MNKYTWKIDLYKDIDANDVGKELKKIEQTSGITKENVLEYAKDEKTTLNKMFEWDDSIAGEKYRLEQAKHIIGNIHVEYIQDEKKEGKSQKTIIRAFVKTKNSKNEEYKNIKSVISDAEQYALLLNQAYKELNSTKNKYAELQEIQELLADIPEIL